MPNKIKFQKIISIIDEEIGEVLSEQKPSNVSKRYASDRFSLDKVKINDPALASSIEKMSALSKEDLLRV